MTSDPRLVLREKLLAERDRRKRMMDMKEDAEQDFLAFVKMMWPVLEPGVPFKEGWIIDLLCDVLMAITDGELTRVCINVPPGSSKSSLLNVLWPAWEWGPCNRAQYRYISISYSDRVPVRDNLRFAKIIKHPVYQQCWGDRVQIGRDGAEWVDNQMTGWKMVSSVSGSVTGFRGDRLLLDDLNNPQQVESEVVRETTNRFVRETMPDRLNDLAESVIVNLQQRTHQEDATGTLLKFGQDYTFVCVPAEFDPLRIWPVVLRRDEAGEAIPEYVWTDPRGLDADGKQLRGLALNLRGEQIIEPGSPMARASGTSFWPERFPEETLLKLKAEKGAYAWSSQYLQIPGVRGGAIIRRDWWKLWQEHEYPPLGTVVAALDTAVEAKETADFNALTIWGAFSGEQGEPLFLLLDAWRDRCSLAELIARVVERCRLRKVDYLVIEHKTRGRDVADEIIRQFADGGYSWETVLYKPEGDKESRLRAVAPLFSGDCRKMPDGLDEVTGRPRYIDVYTGGIIYAPARAWADEVIDEVAAFPYGEHDDYTDTVAMALAWTRKNGVVLRKVEWDSMEYERNVYRKPLKVPYAI